ncbi:MAG: DEAD/DEAH box helicase family protein, partial [Anaerolineaceae bacterium]|nr:DEAD/DEAH box helicase family protein [Anaerolineaceae bacterium]
MQVRIGGLVWLPLDDLEDNQINNIKQKLTIYPRKTFEMEKEDPPPIFMFRETNTHIGVPRYWYEKHVSRTHDEILDVSYGAPMRDLATKYKASGRFEDQENALRVMANELEDKKWGGVLLRAGCGWGKTAAALEFARRLGHRTLILVHKDFFMDQWRRRIQNFMPEARIGVVQQNKCEFEDKDFVLGMLQSLAMEDGSRYPKELYRAFGTVISDEVHRISAQTWSSVIYHFNAAYRVGLTATPRRKDGTADVFFNHISDVTYWAKVEAQVPKLRILYTDTRLRPIMRGSYRVSVDDLNIAQILTQLGRDELRTKDIVDQLVLAVKTGRKIMVVSERIDHLKRMSDMLSNSLFNMDLGFVPRIDFYTGEWFSGEIWESTTKSHKKGEPKLAKRKRHELERAEGANIIFATKQMVEEGLDIEALDVLVLSTPMSDVEQAVGRVRRWCVAEPEKCARLCPWRAGKCEEKPVPIVLDVVDEGVSRLRPKWEARQRFYRRVGALNKRNG